MDEWMNVAFVSVSLFEGGVAFVSVSLFEKGAASVSVSLNKKMGWMCGVSPYEEGTQSECHCTKNS